MTIRDGSPVAEAIQTQLIVHYWHDRIRHAGWFDPEREMAVVLCLNVKYRIVAFALVSLGTLNEAIVHPRDVFRVAIALNSYGILLMHNHPSGDPSPSVHDRDLTDRLTHAAALLQIKFVDHLIIGEEGSLASRMKTFCVIPSEFPTPVVASCRERKPGLSAEQESR